MAFDGIVTKAICSELSNLVGARIDKIFQPNKNNVVIGMYNQGKNYSLNICTESSNCRIHLTTHPNPNPQVAPNFCMVLRKNLLGLHLKNIFTLDLERLVVIDFEGFDEVDDLLNKRLIIELMGKHSNIILLDEQNIIVDSLRHIKQDIEHENVKCRDILPHVRYNFPISEKYNFFEVNDFNSFYDIIKNSYSSDNLDNNCTFNFEDVFPSLISNTFNGFSKSFVNNIINKLKTQNKLSIVNLSNNIKDYEHIIFLVFSEFKKIIDNIGSNNLSFVIIKNADGNPKDYALCITDNVEPQFSLNFFIDDFYFNKESSENFKNYRNSLLKLILNILNKYNKRLLHINQKLKDCDNMETFRVYGELITANLYKFDANSKLNFISVENYYDEQKLVKIPLDKRFSINQNAKRYFKKYNKLKNALDIVGIQKVETEQDLDYIQSVVYELENATSIDDIADIYSEISENVIFKTNSNINNDKSLKNKNSKIKKSKLTKNKKVTFNPIKYTIDDYTVLVGRNNVENDYLTLKYANKSDIWFHVKDFHGSHTILKFLNSYNSSSYDKNSNLLDIIPQDIILKTAKIATEHSKAKNSSNVPVDFCEVRYVKKPSGSKPGMVIYTNYRTVYV